MDHKYLEHIHNEIDGLSTPEERAQLEAYLAANPEVRGLYEDLTTVAGILDRVEAVEPPPHLKSAVLNALQKNQDRQKAQRPGLFQTLIEALKAKPRFAYAYTFVFGLLVGLAVFAIASQDLPASTDLYGTIGAQNAPDASTLIDETAVALEDVNGTIKLSAVPDRVVLELNLETQQPVEVRLAFDQRRLGLLGFVQKNADSRQALTSDEGSLHFTANGLNAYQVLFNVPETHETRIQVALSQAGEVRLETSLATYAP